MVLHGTLKGRQVILEEKPDGLLEGTQVEVIPVLGTHREPSGLCGIWQDERPAHEIVREIREARTGYGGRTPPI